MQNGQYSYIEELLPKGISSIGLENNNNFLLLRNSWLKWRLGNPRFHHTHSVFGGNRSVEFEKRL